MHERLGCDGSQQLNRTAMYFEYPATAAMLLRAVRYGIELGLGSLSIKPFASDLLAHRKSRDRNHRHHGYGLNSSGTIQGGRDDNGDGDEDDDDVVGFAYAVNGLAVDFSPGFIAVDFRFAGGCGDDDDDNHDHDLAHGHDHDRGSGYDGDSYYAPKDHAKDGAATVDSKTTAVSLASVLPSTTFTVSYAAAEEQGPGLGATMEATSDAAGLLEFQVPTPRACRALSFVARADSDSDSA